MYDNAHHQVCCVDKWSSLILGVCYVLVECTESVEHALVQCASYDYQ